jgi:hypothetical protein
MLANRFNATALIAGLMFVVIGSLFLLDAYDVVEVEGYFVLPVLIIGLGIAIMLGGRQHER